jgi:hypothetical protein
MHGRLLATMAKGKELVEFLATTTFDAVYTELAEGRAADPAALREAFATLARDDSTFHSKPHLAPRVAQAKKQEAADVLRHAGPLDEVYSALASKNKGSQALETEEIRKAVRQDYHETSPANREEQRYDDYGEVEKWATAGNERKLMEEHVKHLRKGVDIQDIEARNQLWAKPATAGAHHPGQTVLWIVGVSHLAGLIVELGEGGWRAEPVGL